MRQRFALLIAAGLAANFVSVDQLAANVVEQRGDLIVQEAAQRSPIATELERLLSARAPLPNAPKILRYGPKERIDEIRTGIKIFYRDRDYAPIWVENGKLTKRAREIVRALRGADDFGLDPERILLPVTFEVPPSDIELAEIDARISLGIVTYADHAAGGRIDPRRLSSYMDQGPILRPATDTLTRVVESTNPAETLQAMHPQHPQFKRLLKRYTSLRTAPKEKEVPRVDSGKLLFKGKNDPRVAQLRNRLGVANNTTDHDPNEFDDDVVEAVKAFQRANGLKVDGMVGHGTVAALNRKPVSKTVKLLVNMERWRWMPKDLGAYHVYNNIPEQLTRTMLNGKVIHEERIVVGKYKNQTPIFSDQIEHLVFAPFWNVPDSIKINEILPKLYSSTRTLDRQGLEVKYRGRQIDPRTVNWGAVDIRRYHFYQPPGARNALGRVKFMFPNKHHVYMHDTPSKSLFNRNVRAFSHGCVRVRDPLAFAQLLLSRDQGMSKKRVKALFWGSRNTTVKLKNPVPVHLTYFTAEVDEDGEILTHRDVYRHDKRIMAALKGEYVAPTIQPKPSYSAQRRKRLRELEERRRRQPQNIFEALFGSAN